MPGVLFGLVLFALGGWWARTHFTKTLRNAWWIAPWLGGHVILGYLGRYGAGAKNIMPGWIDLAIVIVFALLIFYWAIGLGLDADDALTEVAKDSQQIDYESPQRT